MAQAREDMNMQVEGTPRQTRRVRFAEESSLYITEKRTEEDFSHAWYTRQDVNAFKASNNVTSRALHGTKAAKLMQHIAESAAYRTPQMDVNVKSKEFILGIEHLIDPEVTTLLLTKRRKTIRRVLAVQQAKRQGMTCPELHTESEINSAFAKEFSSRLVKFQYSARCASSQWHM